MRVSCFLVDFELTTIYYFCSRPSAVWFQDEDANQDEKRSSNEVCFSIYICSAEHKTNHGWPHEWPYPHFQNLSTKKKFKSRIKWFWETNPYIKIPGGLPMYTSRNLWKRLAWNQVFTENLINFTHNQSWNGIVFVFPIFAWHSVNNKLKGGRESEQIQRRFQEWRIFRAAAAIERWVKALSWINDYWRKR